MEEFSQWQTNFEQASVMISNGSIFTGKINIKNFPRLSDLMKNGDESYITFVGSEKNAGEERTYLINKQYVVWLDAGPSRG